MPRGSGVCPPFPQVLDDSVRAFVIDTL